MLVMVGAMLLLPVMDGFAKILMTRYPTLEIVWARYFFHFVFLLPLAVWHYGARAFRVARPSLHFLRGCLLLSATACFFGAISVVPLVDAVAIMFVYPFIVTALAPWVLGEPVGVWRWGAVAVGFIGALIVIRPGFQSFSPAMLMAFGAACSFAVYVLVTRKMAGRDPPLVTLMLTGAVGAAVTTALLPLVWVMPTTTDFMIMVLLGLLAALGHYGVIVAHEWASAPQLAPYSYVEIVSATIVGYLLFGDLPAALTWLGAAIIVASGIVIAWREARIARRERREKMAKE